MSQHMTNVWALSATRITCTGMSEGARVATHDQRMGAICDTCLVRGRARRAGARGGRGGVGGSVGDGARELPDRVAQGDMSLVVAARDSGRVERVANEWMLEFETGLVNGRVA